MKTLQKSSISQVSQAISISAETRPKESGLPTGSLTAKSSDLPFWVAEDKGLGTCFSEVCKTSRLDVGRPGAHGSLSAKCSPPGEPTVKACVLILSAEKKKRFSTPSSLAKTLKQFGYAPLWAADPGEALRHMRFEPVDLFVCDLGRPLHVDRDLIEIFHEANPRIPIILYSPVQSVDEALIASRYGTLLYKPISHLALIETMGMLLADQAKASSVRVKDSQPLVPSH